MSDFELNPRFEILNEKKFVGKSLKMSFAANKTFELWRGFMPLRNEIKNAVETKLHSIEIYDEEFFKNFDPTSLFEKWAAIEVTDFENIPQNLETLVAPEGLYAVFTYKGKSSAAMQFYQNIFQNWLPNSEFLLDARPHFAVMGEKYKNDSDDSEEEIFIPIRKK